MINQHNKKKRTMRSKPLNCVIVLFWICLFVSGNDTLATLKKEMKTDKIEHGLVLKPITNIEVIDVYSFMKDTKNKVYKEVVLYYFLICKLFYDSGNFRLGCNISFMLSLS